MGCGKGLDASSYKSSSTPSSHPFAERKRILYLPDINLLHRPGIAHSFLRETSPASSPVSSTGSWSRHLEATAVARLLPCINGLEEICEIWGLPLCQSLQGHAAAQRCHTQHANRIHGRVDHLFQGCFRGIQVEKDIREKLPWHQYGAISGIVPVRMTRSKHDSIPEILS